MSAVKILIHGKPYEVACDDGQELHLRSLAEKLSTQVGDFATRYREAGNHTISMDYLLLLSALSALDQVEDLKAQIAQLGNNRQSRAEMETVLTETLDAVAQRVERLMESI